MLIVGLEMISFPGKEPRSALWFASLP